MNRRYSKKNRNKRAKRKRGFIKLAAFILIIAALVLFVLNYYDDVETELYKLNYPNEYSEYVEKAAEDYSLDEALIYAVIKTESNFNPDAVSNAGAKGIMQIMPSSFEWLQIIRGCEGEYEEDDLFNPEICIDYGCYLLRYFYDLYETEVSAVAAYNAGFVVGQWLESSEYSSDGVNLDSIPYPETEEYVKKVERSKEIYSELY